AGVFRLSGRLRPEPTRAALRHRSLRSGEVVDADERLVVLGCRLSRVELPPRASLLSGRALLQPAASAAAAAAVLREARHRRARLRRAGVAIPRDESQ